MLHLYPQPDEIGIADAKRHYKETYGREITHDEARQIMLILMRYLYHMNWMTDAERKRLAELEARQAEEAATGAWDKTNGRANPHSTGRGRAKSAKAS